MMCLSSICRVAENFRSVAVAPFKVMIDAAFAILFGRIRINMWKKNRGRFD